MYCFVTMHLTRQHFQIEPRGQYMGYFGGSDSPTEHSSQATCATLDSNVRPWTLICDPRGRGLEDRFVGSSWRNSRSLRHPCVRHRFWLVVAPLYTDSSFPWSGIIQPFFKRSRQANQRKYGQLQTSHMSCSRTPPATNLRSRLSSQCRDGKWARVTYDKRDY